MANVGSLNVKMALESAQFIAGLKSAAAQTQATGAAISKTLSGLKTVGATLAATFAVDMIRDKVQAAFDFADAIADLSAQTGASAKTIQEFRYAAQMTGGSFESADGAISKFTKNLGESRNGNDAMTKALRGLGVTTDNVDTALRQAADGIAKISTPAGRAAAAMSIFGKSAGDLAPLLSQGRAGFDELASAAADLGIVIDDDLINNAGQVNDKMDQMRMIMDAQFASMIVKNADAIGSLANSVMTLVSSLIQFWAQNPKTAMGIMGALGGAAVGFAVGGLPGAGVGAVAGGVAGVYGGYRMGQTLEDGNMDPKFRAEKLRKAKSGFAKTKANRGKLFGGSGFSDDVKAAAAEVIKQDRLAKAALAAINAGRSGGGRRKPGVPALPGIKPKPEKKAPNPPKATPQKTDAELADQWMRANLSAQNDLLSSRSELESDFAKRSDNDRKRLDNSQVMRLSDIDQDTGTDKEVREGKKKFTNAQALLLKATLTETYLAENAIINRRENEQLSRDALDIGRANFSNAQDDLQGQLSLARGRTEQANIQKQIIANQYEQQRLELAATIASKDSTKAQIAIAQARLTQLGKLQSQDQAAVDRQYMGPMASMIDAIPRTSEEINEALENVEVNGLQTLQDSLMGCIMGTAKLGDAFKSMSASIISDLIKIAIQQAVIKPLAGTLFGGSSGGGGLGSLIGGLTGARANGGLTRAGSYLVGERGPEIVNIGNTANVVDTRKLGVAGGGGATTVNSTVYGVNDPYMVRRMSQETIMQALPASTKLASDRTARDLRRPRMR